MSSTKKPKLNNFAFLVAVKKPRIARFFFVFCFPEYSRLTIKKTALLTPFLIRYAVSGVGAQPAGKIV